MRPKRHETSSKLIRRLLRSPPPRDRSFRPLRVAVSASTTQCMEIAVDLDERAYIVVHSSADSEVKIPLSIQYLSPNMDPVALYSLPYYCGKGLRGSNFFS